MKILHVYKDYPPVLGGIEKHIQALSEAQAAAGNAVSVLVTHGGRGRVKGLENGVQVVRVASLLTLASTPLSLRFPLELRAAEADIVHLHFPYPPGEISQYFLGRGHPYVITYHSDIINPRQQPILRLYRPLLIRILRGASRILPTSPNYVRSSSTLAAVAGRCSPVPLGIDPSPFLGAGPLLPPSDRSRLLFVGRHRYYKGVPYLLEALKDLPAELLVVGDGPERASWQHLAHTLELGDRVSFTGEVPERDLPGLYASADIFVLPAHLRAEAFGVVLLEAMASGLPCVTSELGTGTSFVVQHGQTGLVVPPADPHALAEALRRLVADPTYRRELGSAGRARVHQEFTLDRMVQRIGKVYDQVLDRGAGSDAMIAESIQTGAGSFPESRGS